MARPKLDTPNYRLVQRGGRFHVTWWEDGKPRSISTGQTDKRQACIWLNQFIAGQGTPEPPPQPTVGATLDGYLADPEGQARYRVRNPADERQGA